MKPFFLILSSALLLSFTFSDNNNEQEVINNHNNIISPELKCPSPPSFVQSIENDKVKQTAGISGNDIDRGWYQKAMEQIEKEEYNISYDEKLGAYQSPNRVNNIRFIYHKDGFTAKTRDNRVPLFNLNDKTIEEKDKKYETIDEWSIKLKVENGELKVESEKLQAAGNKAWIENDMMRIDYTNTKDGMRQDFIVKQKPAGEGKLRLNFSAETKLKMIVGADALMFRNDKGEEKMKYSALKVWDANGKELRAYFEKNNHELGIENYELRTNSKVKDPKSEIKTNPDSFCIVVNDEDAVYPITIDPLSTSPNWTAESNQANALFGSSVSTAGDVNGDGYSDVIIGANGFDNGQTDEGRAFVYNGSASGLSPTANWTAESDQANARFGSSVSTAGDVNGDGYSDVIVGLYAFDNGQTDEGRAYVYHGSASGLGPAPNWVAEGNQASASFGFSVSTAGDVNGDGYSDVIVGAYAFDNGQTDEGRAYVYHGSASGLSATASWTAESNQGSAFFGYSVSTAGDVNGDGFSDVIVGAYVFDNGQTDEGRAFVYHGSAAGLAPTANWTAESDQPGAQFGNSVSTAGDVNGDGYSDVIVGAWKFTNYEGKAFVYHGSASGLATSANWTAESNQANVRFGSSVSTAGDVNGDGYSDVIVGSDWFDNVQPDEGRAYVYHGSASGLAPAANWTVESDQLGAQFGNSVSIAGDVNGDGYSDVIVGAFLFDNGQLDEGRAFVYHGSAAGLAATASWTAESDQQSAYFGYSVSAAGDVNGDGYADVIIGANGFDNGQTDEGRAFVYHGSASGLAPTANWSVESDQANARFGTSVSTAGDVNGDGYSDVIVGAYVFDNGQTDEGRAFVYHGSASGLSATANWTAESDQANAHFGISVSTAGDVNGDGYSDVIVGAPSGARFNEGEAFVYHGSASGLSANKCWIDYGGGPNRSFGNSVSTAGDVNGDGYSDVIVGAWALTNGQANEGKAFVYHGSGSGLAMTANWTAESNQAGARFGSSLSTAGDVNGDGYSDVIVGADWYDNGQSDEGRAFVYHGSASGLAPAANWTAESDQIGASFGWSVSAAGDVNGDGYSDVIVGAYAFDNGQTDEGRAYVYHGSASGLSATASWTAESDQGSTYFGYSVSTAGDVNGDGFSDVIVGAPFYQNGQTQEGRAFVYYGNGGTGLRSTVQQYKPGTTNIISSGGLSGTDGQARLNLFGRSNFGRADGKIVYEYKDNGLPFSGAIITNSTLSSGSGIITDLGTSPAGVQLNNDISGLLTNKVYKWRARVQYSLVNNPYQKFGPWKYFANYVPLPSGSIRAKTVPPSVFTLSFKGLIQGFYNSATNSMIGDTVQITLYKYSFPDPPVGTAKALLDSTGSGTFSFTGIINNTLYHIKVNHRNSIETWSNATQVFTNSSMVYDFTTASAKAYGNNMMQVDASPVRFAFYGGDVNQDGTVDATDVSLVDNDAANYESGYVVTDLTGDNYVDGTDFAIADNNAANFVSAIWP
ncbi:MAG: FG-GAP-like repeat-containing protein [Ignavibacteria bacterium]|nr:FG-GAP-like repeat-containing protein [Ignavibacteria bacterium]